MGEADLGLIKVLSGGGVAAGLMFVIYKVVMFLAREWSKYQLAFVEALKENTASLKEVSVTLKEHTTVDLEHHALVFQAISRLDGKIDGSNDERERSRTGFTPIQGTPVYADPVEQLNTARAAARASAAPPTVIVEDQERPGIPRRAQSEPGLPVGAGVHGLRRRP